MIFSNPVKSSSMKWSTWMWVTCSKVFQVHAGPPLFSAALMSCTSPGSAVWPSVPSLGLQPMTGTTVSRGTVITLTSWWPGETCSSISVSERAPWIVAVVPPIPCWCSRVSEPISRMFSALLSLGGWLPTRPSTLTRWMLSQSARYLA